MPHTVAERNRRPLIALLTSIALIAAACGGSDTADEDSSPTTESVVEVSVAEDPLGPRETTTTEAGQAEVNELTLGGPVEPGRFETDLLGTSLQLDVDENWIPAVGGPGGFIIEHVDKLGDFTEGVLFTRMSSFGSASDIDGQNPAGQHLAGPADDFDAWLNASGELLIDADDLITIAGTEVRQVQVRVDPNGVRSIPGGCGPTPEDRCFFVGGTLSETLFFYIVRTTEVYRMWLVPQPGFDEPILITAIASEGNEAFLDAAGELVQTMTFGEPEPHPVELPDGPLWEAGLASIVPLGPSTIPALGGLRFKMSEERFVFQDQNFVVIESTVDVASPLPPTMVVALAAHYPNGDLVDGLDGFLATLDEIGTATPSGDSLEILGSELTGYDYVADASDGTPPGIGFSSAPAGGASNFAWAPNPFMRMYLAETSEGVLVVGYDGFTEADQVLGQAVFDEVAPTLIGIDADPSQRIPDGAS